MLVFNYDLYQKVRQERRKLGLSVSELQIELNNHHLIGKKLINKETNKIYAIEGVFKEFCFGWFIKFLVRGENDSHAVIYYENINCKEQAFVDKIKENFDKYEILMEQ